MPALPTIPGLQRTTALCSVLRCARETFGDGEGPPRQDWFKASP